MKRSSNYNTKQQKAVLDYIASLCDTHVTAAQIVEHFEKEEISISRTTIYRHLEKLTLSGRVRKYTIDGVSGACFQYIDKNNNCQEHFHLKCENCGELMHLDCGTMDEAKKHIFENHEFVVNTLKTVLYGKCYNCLYGG